MRERIMRTLLFFDLPTLTYNNQRSYRKFHHFLISEGFIMMQESVYSKICLNYTQNKLLMNKIRLNTPKEGLVQVLNITERQYASIEYISGERNSNTIDSTDRLVIL